MTIDNKVEETRNGDKYSEQRTINYIPVSAKITVKTNAPKETGFWGKIKKFKMIPLYLILGVGLLGGYRYYEKERERENEKQLKGLRNMDFIEYVAKEGDSLYKICEMGIKSEDRQKYNNKNTLEVIFEKNPSLNRKTGIINPGQRVKLPCNLK